MSRDKIMCLLRRQQMHIVSNTSLVLCLELEQMMVRMKLSDNEDDDEVNSNKQVAS